MHYSNEEKAMWLEDWKKSGKSAWAYAKEAGIVPQTFVGWTKLRTSNKHRFVEVTAKAKPTLQDAQVISIEKGGVKIHVPMNISNGQLRMIIDVLGSAA
jgi:hypothetical protein